jgi:hypothetical protein
MAAFSPQMQDFAAAASEPMTVDQTVDTLKSKFWTVAQNPGRQSKTEISYILL